MSATATDGPIGAGDPVTLTAELTHGTGIPTGTATLTTTEISAGPHAVRAAYAGDAAFAPSSATTASTVGVRLPTAFGGAVDVADGSVSITATAG